jgi:hypothetical protein
VTDPYGYNSKCFAKSESIVSRAIAGEVILVPIRKTAAEVDGVYTLNEVAARIWELLDGERTVEDIRGCIVDEFDVSAADAERDLVEFLMQLQKVGAVKEV